MAAPKTSVIFLLHWNVILCGCYSSKATGSFTLSANSSYVLSFQPLTLNCTASTMPQGGQVSFEVNDKLKVRIEYSHSKCQVQKFDVNGTAIGVCTDECRCELEGKSYIWIYKSTADNEVVKFLCSGVIGNFTTKELRLYKAKAPLQPPTITQSPANPVKDKDNITLTCEVSGGIPLAVVSLDCGRTVSNITNSTKASHSVAFEVGKADNGRICNCSATHPVAEYKPEIQHQLVVYYIPDTLLTVTMIPDRIIDVGENVTLSCTVEGGNPLATLKWDCGDDVTNNSLGNKTSSSVHFKVDKYDNGKKCNCSAFHPISTYNHARQHTITVYYPPSNPSLIINQGIPLLEANITELRCSVSDTGNPTSVFTWMWNQTNVSISDSNTLRIGPMKKADNGAVVTCRVKNSYSERKGLDIQINKSLNVEYYPLVILENKIIVIVEGKTLSVNCIVIGNPVPTAKWFRQGQNNPLFGGRQESNLTKQEVDRHDSGRYFCVAISSSVQYGNLSNSAYLELIVNYPPDVNIESIFDHEYERTVVYLCNATGNPKNYTYTGWEQTYNDIVIRNSYQLASFTGSNNRSVTLSHLSYKDSGNYTCFVNNGVPDRNGDLQQFGKEQLYVKGSPELLNSLPPDDTFSTHRGGNITVDLKFLTFPNITKVYWYNVSSNSPIETDNLQDVTTSLQMKPIETKFYGITVNVSTYAYKAVLQLTNFTAQMEGTYILVVQNGFEDRNITFKALISSKPEDPTDLNVTGRTSTKITVLWNRGYNGGHSQHFNISVADNAGIRSTKLVYDDFNQTQMFTLTDLSPATDYVIRLYAQNKIDKSNTIQINATTDKSEESKSSEQNFPIGAVAGTVTGIMIAVAIIIILIYIKRRCIKKQKGEDGLKDNILYESAGPDFAPTQGTSRVENAVVTKNKEKHKLSEDSKTQETTLYPDVIRKTRNEQKVDHHTTVDRGKQMEGKFEKNKKESHADADKCITEQIKHDTSNSTLKQSRNKDGLEYADLVFNPSPNGPKFIHGLEDRTIYAVVDTTQKIDPLLESDEEDFNDQK